MIDLHVGLDTLRKPGATVASPVGAVDGIDNAIVVGGGATVDLVWRQSDCGSTRPVGGR